MYNLRVVENKKRITTTFMVVPNSRETYGQCYSARTKSMSDYGRLGSDIVLVTIGDLVNVERAALEKKHGKGNIVYRKWRVTVEVNNE